MRVHGPGTTEGRDDRLVLGANPDGQICHSWQVWLERGGYFGYFAGGAHDVLLHWWMLC